MTALSEILERNRAGQQRSEDRVKTDEPKRPVFDRLFAYQRVALAVEDHRNQFVIVSPSGCEDIVFSDWARANLTLSEGNGYHATQRIVAQYEKLPPSFTRRNVGRLKIDLSDPYSKGYGDHSQLTIDVLPAGVQKSEAGIEFWERSMQDELAALISRILGQYPTHNLKGLIFWSLT